jgi:hypothetical protein
MKRSLCGGFALIGSVLALAAPTAGDLNEGTQVSLDSGTGAFTFAWWGRANRTYFIQTSETLTTWTYLPVIETGTDAVIQYGFTSNGTRLFFRLRHTDQTSTDPNMADFDGDGIPNGWELAHGLDPLNASDAAQSSAKPGFTNLDEFRIGTDPRVGLSANCVALVDLKVSSPLEP